MEFHDYMDPVKRKAREELQYFIKHFHVKPKRRKGLKVVTFLGPNPEEELEQIWDPLDIQRGNILCIEFDKDVTELVESKKLGVRIINQDATDFLLETEERFNIINLDYDQPLVVDNRKAMNRISGRGKLGDKGILATWFMGSRETRYSQMMYNLPKYLSEKFSQAPLPTMSYEEMSSFLSRCAAEAQGKLAENPNSFNALDNRGDIITKQIILGFADGILSVSPHPLLNVENFKAAYDMHWKALYNSPQSKDLLKKLKINLSEEDLYAFFHVQQGSFIVKRFIRDVIFPIAVQEFSKLGTNLRFSELLIEFLYDLKINPYICHKNQRYKYISKSGTPMFVDFFYFKQANMGPLERIIDYEVENGVPVVHAYRPLHKFIERELEAYFKSARRSIFDIVDLQPRVYLGSSCTRPRILKYERTPEEKEEIYFFLEEGFPDREILGVYDGLTSNALAAYKAHLTMRRKRVENEAHSAS